MWRNKAYACCLNTKAFYLPCKEYRSAHSHIIIIFHFCFVVHFITFFYLLPRTSCLVSIWCCFCFSKHFGILIGCGVRMQDIWTYKNDGDEIWKTKRKSKWNKPRTTVAKQTAKGRKCEIEMYFYKVTFFFSFSLEKYREKKRLNLKRKEYCSMVWFTRMMFYFWTVQYHFSMQWIKSVSTMFNFFFLQKNKQTVFLKMFIRSCGWNYYNLQRNTTRGSTLRIEKKKIKMMFQDWRAVNSFDNVHTLHLKSWKWNETNCFFTFGYHECIGLMISTSSANIFLIWMFCEWMQGVRCAEIEQI